jgi:hypothetical protein
MKYDDQTAYLDSKLLIFKKEKEILELKAANKSIYFSYKNGTLGSKRNNYSLDDITSNRYSIRGLEKEFGSKIKTLSDRYRFSPKRNSTFYGEEFLCD